MPVPSKVLVLSVSQTCMNVCYHDNHGLYMGLTGYEGWPVEMFYPVDMCAPKIRVQFTRFVI